MYSKGSIPDLKYRVCLAPFVPEKGQMSCKYNCANLVILICHWNQKHSNVSHCALFVIQL